MSSFWRFIIKAKFGKKAFKKSYARKDFFVMGKKVYSVPAKRLTD